MSLLNRLLGIWVVGKTVSSTTPLFMRLILGMAVITLLAVFCGVIFAIFVGGAVWVGYTQLIAQGVATGAALAIVGLSLLLVLLAAVALVQHHCHKAYLIAKRIMYLQSPVSGSIGAMTDAFMRGYHAR